MKKLKMILMFAVGFLAVNCENDVILIGNGNPAEEISQPDFDNENECGAELSLLSTGSWEEPLSPLGCSWYFLTLDVQVANRTSVHCRIISSSEMSCYGNGWSDTCWSAVDHTLYNGSGEFDLGGSCCLDEGDILHGLIACECTGAAYLRGHEGELINGTYDQSKVIFYYEAPSYTCPAF